MTEKDKEALWSQRTAAWKASGESMRRYSLQQGWPPRQLAYWKKRLHDAPLSARTLIPVTVKPTQTTVAMKLVAHGWSLELPASTPVNWLAELLRVL